MNGNRQDEFADICASVINGVMNVGVFLLLGIFPLAVHDAYFDILESKYQFYYLTVIAVLAVSALLGLIMLFVDLIEYHGAHAAVLFGRLKPQNWKHTFGAADAAAAAFWFTALISTLQSDYVYESFWGNEGRFNGLFLLTLYTAFYFMVTRFWKPNDWSMQIFLVSSMAVCLFGITDYFQMDIMGWRRGMMQEQRRIFTSTIGNINTYTAYAGMFMGCAAGLFCMEKKKLPSFWHYICMVISFFAIIMGISDNAYLGVAALFGLTPFLLFCEKRSTGRYLVSLATFFTVAECIAVINRVYADTVAGLEGSAFRVLDGMKLLPLITVLLWAAAAAFLVYERKTDVRGSRQALTAGQGTVNKQKTLLDAGAGQPWCRPLLYAWGAVVAGTVLLIMFLLYRVNIAGKTEGLGSVQHYLLFNDSWGTNRGYIWRKAIEIFKEFPLIRKLAGYGPDTFGILTVKGFYREMVHVTGQKFDSAHNEYLQYLVTVGLCGLISYLAFLFFSLRAMLRTRIRRPQAAALFCGVLCYAVQAVVNLNLPIVTPVMWLLLSMGVALSREKEPGTPAENKHRIT